MSPLEIAAVVFTLANVWLAVKQNIWTWPTGIASVILYGVVFYQSRFYSNAALQIIYLILSIHGWYEWLHGGANHGELHVQEDDGAAMDRLHALGDRSDRGDHRPPAVDQR